MRREQHIPLFLWITAAIVAHVFGGGGVTKVVEQIEETMDIGSFASQVRYKAKFAGKTVEVSFLDEEVAPRAPNDPREDLSKALNDSEDSERSEVDPDQIDDEVHKPDELAKLKKRDTKEQEKEKIKKAEEEKVADLKLDKAKPLPTPAVVPNRRVAVEQHVEDKNQEANPDAEFAGEHANRVKEQTQAQITATDQNAQKPTVGKNFAGKHPEPGNSEETRVAQSEEAPGPSEVAPGTSSDDARASSRVAQVEGSAASRAKEAAAAKAGGAPKQETAAVTPPGQSAQVGRAASEAQDPMAETLHSPHGGFSIARAQEAREAKKARLARAARARVLRPSQRRPDQMLGYGSAGLTARGVNLNIDPQIAKAVVGEKKMADLRKRDGERRRSQHRGSWASVGLQKWQGALQNYVSSVKPGNQTALNTAAVPFARFLNQIHQRLHQVFAHGFLGHLDQLPPKHPLNNQEMSTHMEIALNREDGSIVKLGITKSSGVTAFDVGALESVKKAAPYGIPPGSIISSDGNVYLHWEFHRKPAYACSTYFARPYIINTGQKSAPPRVDPPRRPPSEEKKKSGQRSGSLEQKRSSEVGSQPI